MDEIPGNGGLGGGNMFFSCGLPPLVIGLLTQDGVPPPAKNAFLMREIVGGEVK
jgi:hypothetical protein